MEQSKVTLLKVVNGFLLFFLFGLIVGCSSKPTKSSGDARMIPYQLLRIRLQSQLPRK